MMTKRNLHIEPNVKTHTYPRHKEAAMGKIYYFYGRRAEETDCDKESNHAPVLIQPHGAIIVIKEPEMTIVRVSANTESHFGFAPEELLGQTLSLLLGGAEVERLRDRFLSNNLESATHYLEAARIGRENKVFELLLHRFQRLLILECERKPDDAIPQLELFPAVNHAITQMQRAGNAREVCQSAADEMRRLTGFDRAMVYKFNEDDSGEVIAESLGGDFESYLGLRIANCKLRSGTQGLRIVVDVDGAPSPLVPPGIGAPPDLSYAVTRNLSPAHIKHLSHLGVKASMFIPITNDDRLWGLIALHNHTGPKYVPHSARMACECVARFLSAQTALKERANKHEYIARAIEGHKRLEEIIRLNIELERSNIELDSFAYIVSHELKELLRGIRNYSDFLLDDYADELDEVGVEKLRTIHNLSQRMETLLDSLLYFSRVGQADLVMHEVSLDEVVNETLETIAPRIRESGAEIRRPRPLPTVRADHARVGEIFNNLIVNAIKYNDKPSKWVEIGWEDGAGERESGRAGEQESGGASGSNRAWAPEPQSTSLSVELMSFVIALVEPFKSVPPR
jgi:light-regulated signal transduction histidine kinase (bacteriophytochrome)